MSTAITQINLSMLQAYNNNMITTVHWKCKKIVH